MKKLVTMLITVAMVLTLAVPAFADEVSAATNLTSKQVKAITPKGVKAASYSYTKIKVTWNKINGVDGYKVYRATSKNGTYSCFFTNKSEDKLQVINTDRTTGKTYYYKVRGYKKIGKTTYYTKYSAVTSTYARPTKVKITNVKCIDYNKVRVYWDEVSGATGYQVYKSKKGTDKWSLYKSVSSKYTYATELLYGGDEYVNWEYKVRAYRTVNGKKVYGLLSTPTEWTPDWTIDDIYEELWKYGESLAWTEYEYINADGSPDKNGEYIRPRKDGKKYHFKHITGWNGNDNIWGNEAFVYTNPANGSTKKPVNYVEATPDNMSWDVLFPERISHYTSKTTLLKDLKDLIYAELKSNHVSNPLYWDPYWDFETADYTGVQFFSIYIEKDRNGYKLWSLW